MLSVTDSLYLQKQTNLSEGMQKKLMQMETNRMEEQLYLYQKKYIL